MGLLRTGHLCSETLSPPQKWCPSQKTLGRYVLGGRTWREICRDGDLPTFLA